MFADVFGLPYRLASLLILHESEWHTGVNQINTA